MTNEAFDPNDYLAHLPQEVHNLLLKLVGDRFQSIEGPNFFLNMKRFRMLSKHHRQALDEFLSTPEVAFHLISHLPAHRVMRFIRHYRATGAFQRLQNKYETYKTSALDKESAKLMNIICYALATNNIYTVPWYLFTQLYNIQSETLLANMDETSKGCIANIVAVGRFIYHSTVDKDFKAVQAAVDSLAHDQKNVIYYVNFAKANFILQMHNFKDGPAINFSTEHHTLAGANFEDANLQFVNFRCDLDSVSFEKAIMNQAKLSGKWINNTNFSRAVLKGVQFNDPIQENNRTRIEQCNFSHADLERTVFHTRDMDDCNFTEANLNQTNVTGVEFRNCQFKHTKLKGAIFFNTHALLFTKVAPTVIVQHNIDNNTEENFLVLLRASASNFRDVLAAWHAQQPRGPAEAVLATVMREEMYANDETCLAILRSSIPVPSVPELTITIPPEPRAKPGR